MQHGVAMQHGVKLPLDVSFHYVIVEV